MKIKVCYLEFVFPWSVFEMWFCFNVFLYLCVKVVMGSEPILLLFWCWLGIGYFVYKVALVTRCGTCGIEHIPIKDPGPSFSRHKQRGIYFSERKFWKVLSWHCLSKNFCQVQLPKIVGRGWLGGWVAGEWPCRIMSTGVAWMKSAAAMSCRCRRVED